MNPFRVAPRHHHACRSKIQEPIAIFAIFITLQILTGCTRSNTGVSGQTSSTATTKSGATTGGAAGPTPEEATANQRALDQGPAISAANEAAVKGDSQ